MVTLTIVIFIVSAIAGLFGLGYENDQHSEQHPSINDGYVTIRIPTSHPSPINHSADFVVALLIIILSLMFAQC